MSGSATDGVTEERENRGVAPSAGPGRRFLVQAIIWLTTVLAVVGIFAVWSNRQLLNPENWANTSTKLLQDADVRAATSNYLVDQLYANVDVAGELKQRLPAALASLAGPAAGALQNAAVAASQRALANPQVQNVWRQANLAADRALVAIVNDGTGPITVNGGHVTLNLKAVVASIANRLGLPDVSSKLPASAAHLKILDSHQIKFVQDGGRALKGLALVSTIIVPLLYALAIFLARGRRREALMTVGFAIVLAGVLVFAGRKLVESGVTNSLVKSQANKPAASAVISLATSMVAEIAGAFVIVGVPLIVAAWFAGPARLATTTRRGIAPVLRDHPETTFAVVAVLMALIFIWGPIPATHRPAGIIVFTTLAMAGTAALRAQIVKEFPDQS